MAKCLARRVTSVSQQRAQRVNTVNATREKQTAGQRLDAKMCTRVIVMELRPGLTGQLIGGHVTRTHRHHAAIEGGDHVDYLPFCRHLSHRNRPQ